ncbi:glycoside hydrolase family 97 protein [Roseateles oligotrophus]|uniref:Glycoside hydrolase family 97 protein n=1 Tax=Roseateles oligotrophus TaxID=1769250 RepID=A0ABT2YHX6_9BURK|nr:glycoside hydrolase family 97 protein [Roseateles oligotrophus]MCV2369612.1 glycoside hydrolase family 97 protein [Roseateles oligotrophus]
MNRTLLHPALLSLALVLSAPAIAANALSSPDKHLSLQLRVTPEQRLVYSVQRDGKPVILESQLGLQLEGADLSQRLRLLSSSSQRLHAEHYRLAVGKRSEISYRANEQNWRVANAAGQEMELTARVSNDGVAFRYRVAEAGLARKSFKSEATSFRFAPDTRAWLQPMSVAQTGWSNVNPAYEEHYLMDIAVGTPSPSPAGWVFPALFKSGDNWVALTEAHMDGSFHASRLQASSEGGEYRLGQPMAAEVFTGGGLLADVGTDCPQADAKRRPPPEGGKQTWDGPAFACTLTTPWRVLAIGPLRTVMDSTLGTDLAAPAIAFDAAKIQPGHAAWSWALLKDDATVFEVQKRFIDYAAEMQWNYALIDADWDRKIGYEGIQQLVDYGASKGVGILLWYNSSGAWNKTEYTPKSALLTAAQRRHEFARLAAMGVKGLKIDFFAGDGRSMIQYYVDILNDAAAHGLLVNFHGATLPRGWARSYPNLMTAEAVKGFEFTTFEQKDQDAVARHLAMLPFARNLFDPMDFTPMVFGDIPNIQRSTRNGFELAQAVLLLSGIQHFAEVPEGMATVPAYVKEFLQQLPRRWDESRFITGEPGKGLVIARRAGKRWYVAGINAEALPQTLTLDLGFLGQRQGLMITDGEGARDFAQAPVQAKAGLALTIQAKGGFIAVFK